MPYPRSKIVNLDATEYYHVVTRCVRKSFLCGVDKETGQSYEHRKTWIQNRLISLRKVFCVDICSYAVMSNHTHLVVRINRQQALELSEQEVLKRWHTLFAGTELTRAYAKNCQYPKSQHEKSELLVTIAKYRQRLYDLGWYMKSINEYIAKKANKEDECTGHFWEGRYFSQAILDFSALISTMIYVDLNPLRAGLVKTPEKAIFTSLYRRIRALKIGISTGFLLEFKSNSTIEKHAQCIDMTIEEYLQLINDILNKEQRKLSCAENDVTNIYARLNLDKSKFIDLSHNVENYFSVAVGSVKSMNKFKEFTGRSKIKGASNALRLFRNIGNKVN